MTSKKITFESEFFDGAFENNYEERFFKDNEDMFVRLSLNVNGVSTNFGYMGEKYLHEAISDFVKNPAKEHELFSYSDEYGYGTDVILKEMSHDDSPGDDRVVLVEVMITAPYGSMYCEDAEILLSDMKM